MKLTLDGMLSCPTLNCRVSRLEYYPTDIVLFWTKMGTSSCLLEPADVPNTVDNMVPILSSLITTGCKQHGNQQNKKILNMCTNIITNS